VRTEFAIVGGGLLGLAAAWALARRGREVTVLERHEVGHRGGGSHGTCRIFRIGYEDPEYVRLARSARRAWADLEAAAGTRLLHPTPQLTFGPMMHQVHEAMTAAGAACELLAPAAARQRFPGLRAAGPVLLEPDSAVIAADRALAALAALAGPPVRCEVGSLADDGHRVRLGTTAGVVEADLAIVCAGPWTAGLLGPCGIAVPGVATLEQVSYLAPAGPEPAPMPIFVHYGGEFPYGLPVPGSDRYKIGIHHGGPQIAPGVQNPDQEPDPALSARIDRAARSILPGLRPEPVAVERCVYDNTPDTDFVVDRIGNVVIGSGTSGHGFKFGPLLGEWLADLATGTPSQPAHPAQSGGPAQPGGPPARFALRRFPGA